MLKFIDIIVPISGRFGCNMWYDDGPLPADLLQSSSSPVSQTFDQTQTDNKRTGQAIIIIIIFILVSH